MFTSILPRWMLALVWLAMCCGYLLTATVCGQESPGPATAPPLQGPSPQTTTEIWFGWIDSPIQQLRTIVYIDRDTESKPVAARVVSPDQTPVELPLSDLKFEKEGAWGFTLKNPVNDTLNAEYIGKQTTADRVEGEFLQSGKTLKLDLQRLESLPPEDVDTLGADSVWTGTLNLVIKKLDLRFRVYMSPPYATEDKPRFLFDSLSEKAIGIPAIASFDQSQNATITIPSLNAKYVAQLNEAVDELDGKFIQNSIPLALTMKLLKTGKHKEPESEGPAETNKESRPTTEKKDKNKELHPSSNAVPPETSKAKEPKVVTTESYTEIDFSVTHGTGKRSGKSAQNDKEAARKDVTLAGTLTLPRTKEGEENKKFPAVILVSGSGPQDRNETIGKHKPFEVIAHYLAKNGVASLRYDDRGIGESTGNFLLATTEDFTRDALEVWKYARTLKNIQLGRIGILGHSEGGIVGPLAATWEPDIAFLILLAPPGMTGSEILKSQIDRMSELQGMSEEDRKVTMALQEELQALAAGYETDTEVVNRGIKQAINRHWDLLKEIVRAQQPTADLEDIKRKLTLQIEQQFQQLTMPWYRYFLNYDPAPSWMLIRCPTLALWGSNDVQVLPGPNQELLKQSIIRNSALDATLITLPQLNHLFQTCDTGLPAEYDEIQETIAPVALETIRGWLLKQGIIE